MAAASGAASIPAQGAVAVTPNDGADLTIKPCRALYVGTGGDVVVDTAQADSTVVFKNVQAGSILPVSVVRVRATNTTASNIVALY